MANLYQDRLISIPGDKDPDLSQATLLSPVFLVLSVSLQLWILLTHSLTHSFIHSFIAQPARPERRLQPASTGRRCTSLPLLCSGPRFLSLMA